MDLIIVDYPNGLQVPRTSDPLTQILYWNRKIPNFLISMISFVVAYPHDDGTFLLFYLYGSNVRKEILGYFKNYNFNIKDKWIIINCLYHANLMNPNKNVNVLYILILLLSSQCSLNFF